MIRKEEKKRISRGRLKRVEEDIKK